MPRTATSQLRSHGMDVPSRRPQSWSSSRRRRPAWPPVAAADLRSDRSCRRPPVRQVPRPAHRVNRWAGRPREDAAVVHQGRRRVRHDRLGRRIPLHHPRLGASTLRIVPMLKSTLGRRPLGRFRPRPSPARSATGCGVKPSQCTAGTPGFQARTDRQEVPLSCGSHRPAPPDRSHTKGSRDAGEHHRTKIGADLVSTERPSPPGVGVDLSAVDLRRSPPLSTRSASARR